jgi:phosphopantothenoylcysteine decarboxylase/phosphopantothenate--cysteine ligase
MRCVVTAGPTFEPLDQVRRLTNFSRGRLGFDLATFLTDQGHEVMLLIGEQAAWRGEPHLKRVETFTTTADLWEKLRRRANEAVDAVFHAAAVSDFAFGAVWRRTEGGELARVSAGKISTRLGPLLAELVPTPKLITELRDWFPQARIVGWKYEVDGTRQEVIGLCERQIAESRTDASVANGPAYGAGFGLVRKGREPSHFETAEKLFEGLGALLRE